MFLSPVFSLTWDTYFFTFHSCSCSYGHIKKYVYQAGYVGTWKNGHLSALIVHKYRRLRAKPQRYWTLITLLLNKRSPTAHIYTHANVLRTFKTLRPICAQMSQDGTVHFVPHQRSLFFFFFANYIPEIAWSCDFTGQVTNVEGFYTPFHFNKPAEVRKNNIKRCSLRFDTPERRMRISENAFTLPFIDSYNFSSVLFTLQKLHCCTHTHTRQHVLVLLEEQFFT